MMMKNNVKNVLGGFFVLAFAGLIYADAIGKFGNIGLWTWIFTFCFGAAAFNTLSRRDVAGTCFSLGILAIIWRSQLGLGALSIWTILGITLLVSIGLSLLLRPLLHTRKPHFAAQVVMGEDDTASSADANIVINTRMSSTVRYVRSTDFQSADIQVNMGTVKVFFDEAQIVDGPAYININGSIGEVELYIPRDWQLDNQLNTFIGDINIKHNDIHEGPIVRLSGNFKIGDIDVHYL
jgi:predicted membrane protein